MYSFLAGANSNINRLTNFRIRLIVFALCLFLLPYKVIHAQVLPGDSLGLVALYQHSPGAVFEDSAWLAGPVKNWKGVKVTGNRVTSLTYVEKNCEQLPLEFCDLTALEQLNLSFNPITGSFPHCIVNFINLRYLNLTSNGFTGAVPDSVVTMLTQLERLNLSYNQFTSMPDFTPLASLQVLDVSTNNFIFEDLIPTYSKPGLTFLYQGQNPYDDPVMIDLNLYDAYTFPNKSISGSGNSYHWLSSIHNGLRPISTERFTGIDSSQLRARWLAVEDTRYFTCIVTNPAIPDLSLQSGYVRVQVFDNRPEQTITYTGDTVSVCGPFIPLSAVSSTGNKVSFINTDTTKATIYGSPTDSTPQVFAPIRVGDATIVAVVEEDSLHKKTFLPVTIKIVPHTELPTFVLSNVLPDQPGGRMSFSVQSVPGTDYHWKTPKYDMYSTSEITAPLADSSDLGLYTVYISAGTCFYDSLSMRISALLPNLSDSIGPLIIYELITPNEDGKNETFYIANLDPTLDNEVTIYNASYQVVYHKDNYGNDWNGEGLPMGTYYYLVKAGQPMNTYQGRLLLKR